MPKCFEAFNQATGGPKAVAFVEVVRAEVLVPRRSLQHVVAGSKDRTCYSHQRPLGSAQCGEAAELSLQVGPFGFGGRPCGFAQRSA